MIWVKSCSQCLMGALRQTPETAKRDTWEPWVPYTKQRDSKYMDSEAQSRNIQEARMTTTETTVSDNPYIVSKIENQDMCDT